MVPLWILLINVNHIALLLTLGRKYQSKSKKQHKTSL